MRKCLFVTLLCVQWTNCAGGSVKLEYTASQRVRQLKANDV